MAKATTETKPQPPPTPTAWKHRIVRYGTEHPDAIAFHMLNFRTHDDKQQDVLEGLLEEVGYVDDVIVNLRTSNDWPAKERNVKTLVDGHLRCTLAKLRGESGIPVKYVDLTPVEEKKTLAVFDAISAMAGNDGRLFLQLIEDVTTESDALSDLIGEMSEEAFGELAADEAEQKKTGASESTEFSERLRLRPHEHYDYVLVLATNTHDWNSLVELLELEPVTRRGKQVGVGRAINAQRLIRLLNNKPISEDDTSDADLAELSDSLSESQTTA